jgi:hypothetical protein
MIDSIGTVRGYATTFDVLSEPIGDDDERSFRAIFETERIWRACQSDHGDRYARRSADRGNLG